MFHRLTLRSIATMLLGFAVLPIQLAHSQAARGSIGGEVRDPSGAAIANGQIKLVEIRTNQEYAAE
ncbi:MAG: carboxypeptidase-like regulatory domain-containing protein [Acidobacteriia bacterium]|nr:carboxypeptidase-like regulatory domain-containing protein [Terriglobia bacterium]